MKATIKIKYVNSKIKAQINTENNNKILKINGKIENTVKNFKLFFL